MTFKKKMVTIILGILTVVLGQILLAYISFKFSYNVLSNPPPSGLALYLLRTCSWLSNLLAIILGLSGGGIVGFLIHKKGWLYGSLVGVSITILLLSLITIVSLLPDSRMKVFASHDQANQYRQENLIGALYLGTVLTLETTIGGFLGEKINRMKK